MSARLPNPLNAGIAARFDEVAQILADQNANPYRVRAYLALISSAVAGTGWCFISTLNPLVSGNAP